MAARSSALNPLLLPAVLGAVFVVAFVVAFVVVFFAVVGIVVPPGSSWSVGTILEDPAPRALLEN
jgi:hypothetical protein